MLSNTEFHVIGMTDSEQTYFIELCIYLKGMNGGEISSHILYRISDKVFQYFWGKHVVWSKKNTSSSLLYSNTQGLFKRLKKVISIDDFTLFYNKLRKQIQ